MYGLYTRERTADDASFRLNKEVSLLGSKNGIVCKMLTAHLPAAVTVSDPEWTAWHLRIQESLSRAGEPSNTLVIDGKPAGDYVSLYEVTDVWGVSGYNWTPMLLRMRDLVTDDKRSDWKGSRQEFAITGYDGRPVVYTLNYAGGSIDNGRLTGKWSPPKPSPTNHVFLWPYTLKYFLRCMRESDPDFFAA
jgi:hypothetical protein